MSALMTPVTDHQAAAWAVEFAAGAEVRIATYPARATAETVARGINTGRVRAYRPAGAFEAAAHPAEEGATVWVRHTGGAEVEPLPTSMTVRVRGGAAVVTVEISARCRVCGGPRGPIRPGTFVRDGVRHERDVWTNTCGHKDSSRTVLAEAAVFAQQGQPRPRRELAGIKGGRFCRAVDLIAGELATSPALSALRVVDVLDRAGEHAAADAVRVFRASTPNGGATSARSAALYLLHHDQQAQTEGGRK